MKNHLILLLILIIWFCYLSTSLQAKTLDDLIQEAADLLKQGWSSGKVKEYMEDKYAGYLTRDEINEIVNYADDPTSHVKPTYLESKIMRIPDEQDIAGYHYYTYSPTGIKGLYLLVLEGASARSKAMGGAYTSMYDDPETVYRNPTGVIQHKKHAIGFNVGNTSLAPDVSSVYKVGFLYSRQLNNFSLGGSFLYVSESIIGFEASYQFSSVQFTAGKKLIKDLQAGVQFKINSLSYSYLQNEQSDVGVGLDIGLNYNYQNYISSGATVQYCSQFEFENNYKEKIPSRILWGGTFRPLGNLVTIIDLSYTFWSEVRNYFSNTPDF